LHQNKELEQFRRESNVDYMREEIEAERKRSMGAEEAAKRKYNEFERNLKEEKYKAEEVRRVKVNYDSNNF